MRLCAAADEQKTCTEFDGENGKGPEVVTSGPRLPIDQGLDVRVRISLHSVFRIVHPQRVFHV